MLGAPPAFILSQDRTLRSGPDSPALLEKKSLFARGSPRARSRSPADLGFNSSRNRRAQNLILCLLCLPVHFACLSSPISSIAVSGFQGSPRPVRPREEPIYAARGPRAASSPRSTEPPREARHREGGPGACTQAPGPPPGPNARRRPATPCSPTGYPRSTIGARGLNFRVRNGTGCATPATVAGLRRAFRVLQIPGGACPQGRTARRTRRVPGKVAPRAQRPVGEEELDRLVPLG